MYSYSINTRIGKLNYVWEEGGKVLFLGNSTRSLDTFKSKTGGGFTKKKHLLLEEELKKYLDGKLGQFSIQTRLVSGSIFFKKVLKTLKTVGYGQTVSYRGLAEKAGYPLAWRAAGTVLSKNPLMILIPCHRVIKSSGKLGNFTAGPDIKKFLLELEIGNSCQ
ncbi:MAG: methylated-DNA--[protein]-cysteine S-methyltransferase [Actinomycetota bacterium]